MTLAVGRLFGRPGCPNPLQEISAHEARSCGLLRSGTVATLHQLSDCAAFFHRDRSFQLCRMAESAPAPDQRFALSACAVLPCDVLVLRLPHHGGTAR